MNLANPKPLVLKYEWEERHFTGSFRLLAYYEQEPEPNHFWKLPPQPVAEISCRFTHYSLPTDVRREGFIKYEPLPEEITLMPFGSTRFDAAKAYVLLLHKLQA